jgi:hypothetical protein
MLLLGPRLIVGFRFRGTLRAGVFGRSNRSASANMFFLPGFGLGKFGVDIICFEKSGCPYICIHVFYFYGEKTRKNDALTAHFQNGLHQRNAGAWPVNVDGYQRQQDRYFLLWVLLISETCRASGSVSNCNQLPCLTAFRWP